MSLVRPTLIKQTRPMFAALTAVFIDQPLPVPGESEEI
jgi:hypothetical protein